MKKQQTRSYKYVTEDTGFERQRGRPPGRWHQKVNGLHGASTDMFVNLLRYKLNPNHDTATK